MQKLCYYIKSKEFKMESIILDNKPNEDFLDYLKELSQEFPIEFPNLYKRIKEY